MNMFRASICVVGFLACAQTARAQVPFFNRNPTAFTPQVSIINTGVIEDVQATVSADQKYVTLNMRPANSTLLALRQFTFQNGQNNNGPGGNVGDPPRVPPVDGRRSTGSDDPSTAVRTSPEEILAYGKAQKSVLHQPGMTRVSSLKN